MSIEKRLPFLAALLIEGSINEVEVEELKNLPMTQRLPVTDETQVQATLRYMFGRYSDKSYVADSLMVEKIFGFVMVYLSYAWPDQVIHHTNVQFPIQMPDYRSEFVDARHVTERRKLTSHLAEGIKSPLTIEAIGLSGAGDRPTSYQITGIFDRTRLTQSDPVQSLEILMQDGKPLLNAPSGITIECLLAIAQDQLEHLQQGAYPCHENDAALANIKAALGQLHRRTLLRGLSTMANDLDIDWGTVK